MQLQQFGNAAEVNKSGNECHYRNFGHNLFPLFPSVGLENALHVKVHNNPNLREFPGPVSFPRVQSLALSYAYHCCPFLEPRHPPSSASNHHIDADDALRDSVIFPSDKHDIDLTAWAQGETIWVDSSQFFFFFLVLKN